MRKIFLGIYNLLPVRPLRSLRWSTAFCGGLTALLATSALTVSSWAQDGGKPRITVSTPGKQVNVIGAIANGVKRQIQGDGFEMADTKNAPALPGTMGASTSDTKSNKPIIPYKPAKTPPKYSMKPIVEAPTALKDNEEPPEEFEGDAKPAAKPAAKTAPAAKPAATAKPVAAAPKKKVAFVPVPKGKPAALLKAAAKPVEAEKSPAAIKPAVTKVEMNAPAKEAAVEPAATVKVEAPKVEVKEVPKAEVKEEPKVETPKAEVKAAAKVETPKAEVKEAPMAEVKEEPKAEVKEVPKVEVKEAAKVPEKVAEKPVPKNVSKIAPKVEYSTEGDIEKLKFTFSTPVAAAVFERFGYYWLVFYSDDAITLPETMKNSKLFSATKKITPTKSELISTENTARVMDTTLVFSLELSKKAFAMVQKSETTWEIEFDPGIDYKQEVPVKLEEKPDSWLVSAQGLSARVTVKDEFTNDYIEVFPLLELGFNPQEGTNSKFIFQKTVQGVALKTIGQAEIKSPEKDKLVIYKDASASTPATEERKVDAAPKTPLYAFQKWPQLKADEYRKAESKLRDGTNRQEFGKFLFSQGLYSESAVNLQGERGMEASFLTGASYYMLGRYEDAAKIFDSLIVPEAVDQNEFTMWKAAANFDLGQVNPGAAKPVDMANFSMPKNLDNYPDEIRNKMIFAIAEKQTSDGKYDEALKLLEMLPKTTVETPSQSYMKYLQGKIYDGQGKHARAREIWAEVAKSATDRESQAKATYEVIIQDYNGAKIKVDDAISKLNDIRILWRGDVFEYNLLSQLADFYAKNGDIYEALTTSKEILSSFPNFPHNLAIATRMRDIYQKEVTENFGDKEKTFRAVTIYYEFEELKPPGEPGNQITLQLADALAKYDLLSDASKVLKKYLTTVTDNAQKAEIATRIAILNYLDNKPKDALQMLKDSQSPGLPSYLVQERRILEVRCLIETGDLQKATSMLSSLPDEQANRFKADIYWKQKNWEQMLDVYDLLVQKTDEDIMRMGIAYVMVDNRKALQGLAKRYRAQMEKGPYAQTFDYVTDTDNVDYRNLDASLKLDQTELLLQKYRDRIKTSGLAAVTGGNQKK